MMQAESAYRRDPSDIGSIYLRSQNGSMVPLSTVTTVNQTTGPEVVLRYNLYRTVEVNASTKTGISSGQGIATIEELASKLPNQYGFEWTGMAYQEKQASGQTMVILGLGLVFVFLFLAAQYESWGIPFAVLLSMPTVVLGALLGVNAAGLDMNIYVQIGILTLIGLSAKNAILIVEYAKMNYDGGMDLIEATVEGARIRFRPILMTSFAFILGVLPLAQAQGASAACRAALGVSVMCGMLAATLVGIFIIPVLYVTVQGLIVLVTGDQRKLTNIQNEATATEEKAAITPAQTEVKAEAKAEDAAIPSTKANLGQAENSTKGEKTAAKEANNQHAQVDLDKKD